MERRVDQLEEYYETHYIIEKELSSDDEVSETASLLVHEPVAEPVAEAVAKPAEYPVEPQVNNNQQEYQLNNQAEYGAAANRGIQQHAAKAEPNYWDGDITDIQ